MRRIVLAFALLLFAMPALAQRDFGFFLNTTGFSNSSATDAITGTHVDIDFDRKMGGGLSYTEFFSPNLAADFAYQYIQGDMRGTLTNTFGTTQLVDLGELRSGVWSGIIQWHVSPRATFDPYIGAGAAYFAGTNHIVPEETFPDDPGDVTFDNKFSVALNAGVNFAVRRGLLVALDARYSPFEVKEDRPTLNESIELNPLTVSIGLRFRY